MRRTHLQEKPLSNSPQVPTKSRFPPRPFAAQKPTHEARSAESSDRAARFGHSFGEIDIFPRPVVQPKLGLGSAIDPYEQEADGVEEQLMRMPEGITFQRRCAKCDVDKKSVLQSKESPKQVPLTLGQNVPSIVHDVLRSPGQPLDPSTRAFMGPRFGHGFSQVGVYTDAIAGYQHGTLQLGMSDDAFEYQAKDVARRIEGTRSLNFTGVSSAPVLQRDLARPPRAESAPVRVLTPDEVAEAIEFNQQRFRDPYSISLIRDVMGIGQYPAVVDNEFVQEVVQWQAERRMDQDGWVGHSTTRSFFLELVAEGQYRDAVALLIDSYALPESPRLEDIRIGSTPACCGTADEPADALTSGGMGSGRPVRICVCRRSITRSVANYNFFVRTIGHELVHVRQRAANNVPYSEIRELEAYFWEVCSAGRAPALAVEDRETYALLALTLLQRIGIPPNCLLTPRQQSMLTIEQNVMRLQLINFVKVRHGLSPCPLPAQTPTCWPPATQTP